MARIMRGITGAPLRAPNCKRYRGSTSGRRRDLAGGSSGGPGGGLGVGMGITRWLRPRGPRWQPISSAGAMPRTLSILFLMASDDAHGVLLVYITNLVRTSFVAGLFIQSGEIPRNEHSKAGTRR